MKNGLLTINEVSVLVGRSTHTINYWYKWREDNPEHELSSLLPDYIQVGGRRTRYWKQDDLWRLIEFKAQVPQGRGGIMKRSIHRYYHGGEENAGAKERIGTADSTVCTE